MIYEELMVSDLRDSGGHHMKIVRIADFEANYTMGGFIINPLDFNMDTLEYINLQAITAYQDDPESPAVVASMQTAMKFADENGDEYWKLFVFLPDAETGLLNELPDGTPLSFPPEFRIVLMLTGTKI